LRGLFTAAPGHDLICSDYSAIEAVVLAELSGETWRQEVFRTHGKIYEMSAAKIKNIPFEEFEKHKKETGQHHHLRKMGKTAELASGYGGWINAWKRFGADEFLTDDEIKTAILNWRKASPAVVEFWGGQKRNWNSELYGVEGHAIQAILNPGKEYVFRKLKFQVIDNILYVTLLSGRKLIYHNPRVIPHFEQRRGLQILFEGWNSNPTMGPIGWVKKDTYSGKLTENIAQATARDILAFAIVNLEAKGYPVVLHIHDEIGSEVREDFGSIEEFETIMSTMPEWAARWPVKAHGGWRGKRYRK
jgi:DNA polymerase